MNYKQGLVSVIIPSYQSREYVSYAIETCLNQTYKNLEIIIIDDGSTDGTRELVKNSYNRENIVYYYKTNGGLSSARNAGLKLAKGEYIQFLDADDLIEPTKIEKQVNFLKSNLEIFGVYCGTKYFKNSVENIVYTNFIKHEGNIYKNLVLGNFIPVNSILCRRIEDLYFDETLRSFEDWDYWLRICEQGNKIAYIDEFLCYVRIHENNMSKDRYRMVRNEIIVLEKIKKHGKYLDRIYYVMFKESYLIKDRQYLKYLKECFKSSPKMFIKALLFIVYRKFKGDNLDPYK